MSSARAEGSPSNSTAIPEISIRAERAPATPVKRRNSSTVGGTIGSAWLIDGTPAAERRASPAGPARLPGTIPPAPRWRLSWSPRDGDSRHGGTVQADHGVRAEGRPARGDKEAGTVPPCRESPSRGLHD